MPHTARVFTSIRNVPLDDWNQLHHTHGNAFTDPRFLEVFEATIGSLVHYTPVIVYDDELRPIAIYCLCTCRIDAATLASKMFRRAVGWVRRVWPNYLQFTMVLCGLPVTVPQLKLCVLPSADMAEVLRLLDETARDFAIRHRATAIILGNFKAEDSSTFDTLLTHGYSRFHSSPIHVIPLRHRNIAEYIAAMRHRYRQQIQRDINRFDTQRIRVENVADDEKLSEPIAPEFYEFYLQLLGRVEFHLLTIPREFLNELIRLYHREIHLLRVFVDEGPAGIAMGIILGETYWFMLIAVDADLNRRYGLYPHLFLNRIDYAMSRGLKQINLGTTADEFKLRIGCEPQPQRIYVKVLGLLRGPFRWASGLLFNAAPDLCAYHVFRQDPPDDPLHPDRGASA